MENIITNEISDEFYKNEIKLIPKIFYKCIFFYKNNFNCTINLNVIKEESDKINLINECKSSLLQFDNIISEKNEINIKTGKLENVIEISNNENESNCSENIRSNNNIELKKQKTILKTKKQKSLSTKRSIVKFRSKVNIVLVAKYLSKKKYK